MSYTIAITGDKELIANLDKIKQNLGYGREAILDEVANLVKNDLQDSAPSFTGNLKSSMQILFRGKDERVIGPGRSGSSLRYPPEHYAKYVEEGGGPSSTLPNVEDIALRMAIPIGEAFAFAKYLRDSGRAVREPSYFIQNVAQQAERTFRGVVENWLSKII